MSAKAQTERDRVCIARIGAAHGVRGEVKLWPFTADPLAVANYGPLEAADGTRTFEIETVRHAKDFLVARLKGIADRNSAEALRNIDLYVAREKLPALEEPDEFYHADLVGLSAVDRAGATLGTIVAVHNFGAGDLVELKLDDASDTLLIPFNADTVPDIDVAARRAVVVLPQETE
jgi:16S rRNA processing protein RimM